MDYIVSIIYDCYQAIRIARRLPLPVLCCWLVNPNVSNVMYTCFHMISKLIDPAIRGRGPAHRTGSGKEERRRGRNSSGRRFPSLAMPHPIRRRSRQGCPHTQSSQQRPA